MPVDDSDLKLVQNVFNFIVSVEVLKSHKFEVSVDIFETFHEGTIQIVFANCVQLRLLVFTEQLQQR